MGTFIKIQIEKLVELQEIDTEIYNMERDLKDKPVIIQKLKVEFEAKKSHLKELEEKAKAIQVARKEQELELKGKEGDVSKSQAQLMQLKTNKEYTAKIAEIESIKADKSIFEEKILLSFDESDRINLEIEKEKGRVAWEEKEFLSKEKEIKDDIKQTGNKLNIFKSQREQSIAGIKMEYLKRYQRILEHKDGLAIVPLKGLACGGCFMAVTSQTVNALKMEDHLIECGGCSRILYIKDDAKK